MEERKDQALLFCITRQILFVRDTEKTSVYIEYTLFLQKCIEKKYLSILFFVKCSLV